jgi:ketose-bisphosphate aldolase
MCNRTETRFGPIQKFFCHHRLTSFGKFLVAELVGAGGGLKFERRAVLVGSKGFLVEAKKGNYAVPAPNFFDLDSARVYVDVAERLGKPVILALAEAHLDQISLEEGALVGKFLAERASIPVALHLDHGFTFSVIERAIELGYTSVMIDASVESFEENVRRTKEVVAIAAPRGVQVEAEIGHVGAGENYEDLDKSDSIYTEVDQAREFVDLTKVDSLAVSIGTAHGIYKGIPKLNFERLAQLREALAIPLVLHGSSGSGDENLARVAHEGITKINVYTDFEQAALKAARDSVAPDFAALKRAAYGAISSTLDHYYSVFGTK